MSELNIKTGIHRVKFNGVWILADYSSITKEWQLFGQNEYFETSDFDQIGSLINPESRIYDHDDTFEEYSTKCSFCGVIFPLTIDHDDICLCRGCLDGEPMKTALMARPGITVRGFHRNNVMNKFRHDAIQHSAKKAGK